MYLADAQIPVEQVMHAFHREEPYLFLGAAFTTVAVVSVCTCILRRRFDPLLLWLAVFAFLYGQRLWINADIILFHLPHSEAYRRITTALDFLVPVPAFFFFHAAGFLERWGRWIVPTMTIFFSGLVIATLTLGVLPSLRLVNNLGVMAAILVMMAVMLRKKAPDADFAVVRVGLFSFGILALIDNASPWLRVEPYGFAILLACLGYVAARRSQRREEELGDVQRELALAREIQLSLLPQSFPASAAFQIAARYLPMNSVAGDMYEAVAGTGGEGIGLLIADVSGHGIPAALIASMVKMAVTSQRQEADQPAGVLTAVNRALYGNTRGQYVTAAYVYLDEGRRELRYAAAGHPPMLLVRQDAVIEIAENGLLMGAIEAASYGQRTVPLQKGDRLVLYTDGLVEARSRSGELFGDERLAEAVRAASGMTPEGATEAIVGTVQRWSPLQEDDLTVLVCDWTGG